MEPRSLNLKNNQLYLGRHSFLDIKNKYGTPIYIYDEKEMLSNMQVFDNDFCGNFYSQIVYASKAFLVPKMCELINKRGWMIDAVSLGDLYMIGKYLPFERIVFHGNNKSIEELTYAIQNKVGLIVVDNYQELLTIGALTKKLQKRVQTMFRINPGIEAHTHCYIQTSLVSSKFGESIYDIEVIDKIMKFYQQNPQVILRGFHSHIGSQITEDKAFLLNAETMINFTQEITKKYAYELKEVNLGGGFGITYTNEIIDTSKILKNLSKKIDELIKDTAINKVYLEPGRSIVGRSGMTLYTGSMIKTTYGGKKYLFVDGGMTDNIRPALYSAQYTVLNPLRMDGSTQKVDVVGKCCESGDIVAKDIEIAFEPNDPILVLSTGAYGYSMSSNYNNALKARVILVGDKIEEISRPEELIDVIRLFK